MNWDWIEFRTWCAFVNFCLCSAIGVVCICRASAMSKDTTRKLTRAAYTLLFGAALASGWSPYFFREWPGFGEWPGLGDIAMNSAVLVYMASGMRAWKFGLPDFARSNAAPLDPPNERTFS
jgi:hypothetical protein